MKNNIKYLLSLDYLKPSWFEKILFIFETPLSIFCGCIGYKLSQGNILTTIGSAFIPQIVTYAFFRTLELCMTLRSDYSYQIFQKFKSTKYKSISFEPKIVNDKVNETIDNIVDDKIDNDN